MTHSSSSKKNHDLTKASVIFSIGLVLATFIIRNALLKSHSGRYEWTNSQSANSCMLLDTKTGDCWGIIKGQMVKFNLRKSDYANDTKLNAESFTEK